MKFNQSVNRPVVRQTINKEGATAYTLSPEVELYTTVVTASLQNKFYESETEVMERIRSLITKCDSNFVAQLAVYAREQMYLRSVPVVLTVELNKYLFDNKKSAKIIEPLTNRIIQRADEITEILAYYQTLNVDNKTLKDGKNKSLCKLSKTMQKGIAQAFNKFDEYQFAKYDRKGEVTLKDALFLTHPKPNNDNKAALFKKIADDTLEVPYTWETELSSCKEKDKSKSQVWQELIDSNKLGYMALLRNLRNILQEEVPADYIKKVADKLSDVEAVKKSKQFPFRFLSAYKELLENSNPNTSMILDALEKAIKASVVNIKGFDYNTRILIACDVSCSMQQNISPKSKIEYYDIGLTLGMLMRYKSESTITGIFGDTWKVKNLPKDSVLANVDNLRRIEGEVGYSTNGYKVLKYIVDEKIELEKVMIFTDCQMWNSDVSDRYSGGHDSQIESYWKKYKALFPNAKLYLFDLSGYGTTPIKSTRDDVHVIAGWSDKVFDVLDAIEKKESAISIIKNIKL